ncbi:MAG TPA: lipoate--protein ligase family protein [Abditibacteriaceae bacterium]
MQFLDWTFDSTEENLALEEALLEACDAGGPEVLRVWTPRERSVVVGYAQSVEKEVLAENCDSDNVPILRRITGGGTVLHGTGTLCYALILRTAREEIASVSAANSWIMQQQANAVGHAVNRQVEVQGYTDLALQGRKFSGNAQRRKAKAILFHGTFLLDFDLNQLDRYLRFPSRQPEYRAHRNHADFLTSLRVDSRTLIASLRIIWNASDEFTEQIPQSRVAELVRERYSQREWNRRL